MKSRRIYIGIAAVTLSLVIVISSIFYIKANQEDVEISQFAKNLTENTKEAMREEMTQQANEEAKKKEEEKAKKEAEEKEAAEKAAAEKEAAEKAAAEKAAAEKAKKEAEPIEVEEMSGTKYSKADSLNIRSGPDTSYSKVGSLSYGSEVTITGKSGIWYRISYNNKTGFVRGDYLTDSKPEPREESSSANVSEDSSVSHLIIINSRNNTLRYYRNGSRVASYSCATGTSGTPTPQGKFAIFEKLVNRPYYKAGIAGDSPNNPLGRRWMQFKSGGYAIHGTNNDNSIGTHASHGCVRMHNEDVISLYSMVPIGTTVIVKNTSASDKDIAAGYGIYIE